MASNSEGVTNQSPGPSDKENDGRPVVTSISDGGLVSNESLSEDELEQLAPESAIEEEHRLRQERENQENGKEQDTEGTIAVLEESRFAKLDALLNKAGLYSTFLSEQIAEAQAQAERQAQESAETKASEAAKGKQATRKRKGRPAADGAGKKTKVETRTEVPKEGGDLADAAIKELIPYMKGELRDYQIKGVKWLISLWLNGQNGILADEMGLGKTVQTIGFLSHLYSKGVLGPYLVIGPLSTLPNWVNEFERFVPDIPVILYHGNKQQRQELRQKHLRKQGGTVGPGFPVICTSFEIVMADAKYLQTIVPFKYIVVDEGHRLKNYNCKLIRQLKTIPADNRLLLTGTPLQNNLSELWSLLNYLMPDLFNNLEDFEAWFDFGGAVGKGDASLRIVAEEQRHKVISKLHALLRPMLLRRKKTDVENSLPSKMELILYAHMTEEQKKLNQQLRDKTLDEVMAKIRENGGRAPVGRLNNILMQMRKVCNHPDLVTGGLDGSITYPTPQELLEQCGKLQLLNRLLTRLRAGGHKVLIFSQMTKLLDVLDSFLDQQGHNVCRLDGSTSWQERQQNINKFNSDPEHWVFLLSTRAGGLGINLVAADTVIIYDSDWNPHQDLQAMDRAHRIGQQRPVLVFRLATAHSVEGRMLQRAMDKLTLERLVIRKGAFKDVDDTGNTVSSNGLSAEELMELLKNDISGEETQSGVVDDKMLSQILDRHHLANNLPLPFPVQGVGYEVMQQQQTNKSVY